MNLLFSKQFVNESMTDLISGKIHTIRANYDYWKKHDGKEVSIRVWSGKPYRSKQIEVCKKVIGVQPVHFRKHKIAEDIIHYQFIIRKGKDYWILAENDIAKKDGFESWEIFRVWFADYLDGDFAILHFTDFRY